jgi:hypothetical protein
MHRPGDRHHQEGHQVLHQGESCLNVSHSHFLSSVLTPLCLQVKCSNCGEETAEGSWVYVDPQVTRLIPIAAAQHRCSQCGVQEEAEMSGSRGTANLAMKVHLHACVCGCSIRFTGGIALMQSHHLYHHTVQGLPPRELYASPYVFILLSTRRRCLAELIPMTLRARPRKFPSRLQAHIV